MSLLEREHGSTGIAYRPRHEGLSATVMISTLVDISLTSGIGAGLATGTQLHPDLAGPGAPVALGLHDEQTLGFGELTVMRQVKPLTSPSVERTDQERLYSQALTAAITTPAIDVDRPAVPTLTGDPTADVQALFALNAHDLAELLGVTERHVFRFKKEGVPARRLPTLQGLRAVGLMLVGGLGPVGARAWLDAGSPSSWQLIQDGRLDLVGQRAHALTDSPAT